MLEQTVGLYLRLKMSESSFARALFGLPQEPKPALPDEPPGVTLETLDNRTPRLRDGHPRERGELRVRHAAEIRTLAVEAMLESHKKNGGPYA